MTNGNRLIGGPQNGISATRQNAARTRQNGPQGANASRLDLAATRADKTRQTGANAVLAEAYRLWAKVFDHMRVKA